MTKCKNRGENRCGQIKVNVGLQLAGVLEETKQAPKRLEEGISIFEIGSPIGDWEKVERVNKL